MIRYNLVCEAGHDFESWFPNADSYDAQAARGLVTCPVCDSAKVAKAVMAPRIARTDRSSPAAAVPAPVAPAEAPVTMLAEPERKMREMLRAFREHVTRNADHVGAEFPEQARRMHYGEAAQRPIYGEASPTEARALIEEGIAVAPLPPAPDERN